MYTEHVKTQTLNVHIYTDQHTLGFTKDPNLWCIDNKLYDLTPFISKHPGGEQWLHSTKGMDITGYYYTHHLNQKKVSNILSKYYVKDLSKNVDDLHTFKWNKDCNYFKLQNKIHIHLTNKYGDKYNQHRWSLHILSFLSFIIWCIAFYFLCIYPSIYTAIIAGCFLHPFIGIGHNYFHQADFKGFYGMETYWRYLFNFTMFSFESWRLSHAISHHLDINLSDDFEVSALEPIIYCMTNSPTNSPFVYIYIHLFHFLIPGANYIINTIKGQIKLNHIIPLIQLTILIAMNVNNDNNNNNLGIWQLIWYWYVMHGTVGYILVQISTPVHRSDYCWTEGDKNGTKDFLHHTLLTTVDYNTNYPMVLSLFLYEMFNDHRIHHLFPILDLSLIKDIRPIFEQFCQENNLECYVKQNYTFTQLLVGLYRYYYRVHK